MRDCLAYLESTSKGLRLVRDNLADIKSTCGGLRQVRDNLVVHFCSSSKIKKSIFCRVTFLGGHVMVSELRKYQIRIPREILGRSSGLTFVLAQKLKNQFLVTT